MSPRELDSRVAQILAGLGKNPYGAIYAATWEGTLTMEPPAYSTDIAAAWYVLETLRDHFSNVVLCGDNGWGLSLGSIGLKGDDDELTESWLAPINAETAPRAICLAFVQALDTKKATA